MFKIPINGDTSINRMDGRKNAQKQFGEYKLSAVTIRYWSDPRVFVVMWPEKFLFFLHNVHKIVLVIIKITITYFCVNARNTLLTGKSKQS